MLGSKIIYLLKCVTCLKRGVTGKFLICFFKKLSETDDYIDLFDLIKN